LIGRRPLLDTIEQKAKKKEFTDCPLASARCALFWRSSGIRQSRRSSKMKSMTDAGHHRRSVHVSGKLQRRRKPLQATCGCPKWLDG
jgi:hypothetical protein